MELWNKIIDYSKFRSEWYDRLDPWSYKSFTKSKLGEIKQLLLKGADINFRPGGDKTPILLAIFLRLEDVVALLLKYGANPSDRSLTNSQNALCLAISKGSDPIVRLLIEAGADIAYEFKGNYHWNAHYGFGHGKSIRRWQWQILTPLDNRRSYDPKCIFEKSLEKWSWRNYFRPKLFAICIGLQMLRLPAFITLSIFDELHEKAKDIKMFRKWNVIVKIKHFK